MLVVNLFGGPGCGKSTTAAGVFSKLKLAGINAEYVSEFAKDLTWEKRIATFDNQLYIFAKQYHRIWRVYNQVEVVVTDSPLFLSLIYGSESDTFRKLALEKFQSFENLNIVLNRKKKYNPIGRSQTEHDAICIDNMIGNKLRENSISFSSFDGDENGIEIISKLIRTYLY